MQPTGEPHIGNLIGALDNWVRMQEDFDTIYCVVDLHAMTTPYDVATFRRDRVNLVKMIVAAGVDPARSLLYCQSEVPQHVELSWMLGTITGLGQLERMTQFKEKADRSGQNLGLLAYPVLQAADILIHRVHAVPVGDDQAQHLELTRDLAERFNARFGEVFPVPERITPKIGARVMSLSDPGAKMSKSDPPKSRVNLTDSDDEIVAKIRAAVTDAGTEVAYDWESKPGVSNLIEMHAFFSGRDIDDIVEEYRSGGYGSFKSAVAEAVSAGVGPIRDRYLSISDGEARRIMDEGAAKGRKMAEETMTLVRESVGLS
jgi:tryptophanyl-tRNA synthetase